MSASLVTRPLIVVCCAASVAGTNPNANATRASVLREGSLMTLATPLDVEDTNATVTRSTRAAATEWRAPESAFTGLMFLELSVRDAAGEHVRWRRRQQKARGAPERDFYQALNEDQRAGRIQVRPARPSIVCSRTHSTSGITTPSHLTGRSCLVDRNL